MQLVELNGEIHQITLAGRNTLQIKNQRTKKVWEFAVPEIGQKDTVVDLRNRAKRLQGKSKFAIPTDQFIELVDKLCGDNCGICGTRILTIVARHRRTQTRLQLNKAA
ncbi:MAG: hypothetical protein RI996_452 [Candidatus Parcubacteria bacterium]|jgi:hypothetical protein